MWKHLIRAVLIVVLLIGIVAVLVGCAIAVPKFDKSKLEFHPQPTVILDQNNQVAIKVNTQTSDYVSFDQISDWMKKAIVATEDNRFYEHSGIDFRGIARALFFDILHGGKEQGASTITQQLAKNVYLNQGKTFTRKFQEAILAAQIEHNFSKDEILEKYLNTIYFGDGQTGVQDAAQAYFGVPAKDLKLEQAALLAALPKAPSYYDPYVNPDQALERRNLVLDLMYKYGYITDEQRKDAQAKPLGIRPPNASKQGQSTDITYPFYLDYVIEDAKANGVDPQQIYQGGLTIYTNLNTKIQAQAEKAYQNDSNFPRSAKDQMIQSGCVFIDPHTGGVLAIVGNRGPHTAGFNYATMSQRSPGSAIKPLVDYGPAIDLGLLGLNDPLEDRPMTFGNGYRPMDWDRWSQHRPGTVDVREALRESWNVPAVWTMDHILGGPEKGIAFAKRAGLPFDDSDYNLSVAIGGMKTGVSPLQMAQAYSAFANDGVMIQAHAINKIENAAGEVLYQFKASPTQVMKKSTATIMTDLLTTVVQSGTGVRAQIPGVPVAGKTGTAEYENGGDRDAWFVGYTPKVVGAIWMGYPKTDDNHYMTNESGYPAGLFSTILAPALRGEDPGSFSGLPADMTTKKKDSDKLTVSLQGKWDPQTRTVTLTWNDLQKDGVKYTIFRKGTDSPLATVDKPGFVDTNPPINQSIQYIVVATYDTTNIQSNIAVVTTDFHASSPDMGQPGTTGGDAGNGQQQGTQNGGPDNTNPNLPGQPNQGGTGGSGTTGNGNQSGQTGGNGSSGTPGAGSNPANGTHRSGTLPLPGQQSPTNGNNNP
jgi:penicillin-binding protein 2A